MPAKWIGQGSFRKERVGSLGYRSLVIVFPEREALEGMRAEGSIPK
jgi:hypothetical protein